MSDDREPITLRRVALQRNSSQDDTSTREAELTGEIFAAWLAGFRQRVEKLLPATADEKQEGAYRNRPFWRGQDRGAILLAWWEQAEPREAEAFRADLIWASLYFSSLSGAISDRLRGQPPVLREIRRGDAKRARGQGRPELARLRTELPEEFWRYDARRPDVYTAVKRLAFAAREDGRQRVSMRGLLDQVRKDGVRHSAYHLSRQYALKLMADEPRLEGMFAVTSEGKRKA